MRRLLMAAAFAALWLMLALLGGCVTTGAVPPEGPHRIPDPAGMIGAFFPADLPPSTVPDLPPVFHEGDWAFEEYFHPDLVNILLRITKEGDVKVFESGVPIPFEIKNGRIWVLSSPEFSLYSRPEKHVVGICADMRFWGLAGQMFRKLRPGEVAPPME